MGSSGKPDGVITAGHCVPNGGTWKWPNGDQIVFYSGARENWNPGVGTVGWNGGSVLAGDLAWGYNTSSTPGNGKIYTGSAESTTGIPVKGKWTRTSLNGDQYCVGGARTGETCAWVVWAYDIRVYYTDTAGNPEGSAYPVTKGKRVTGKGTGGGDSGGAVYTVDANGKAWAKGVHSGGTFLPNTKDPATCTGSAPCWEYFTEMTWASKVFPGSPILLP